MKKIILSISLLLSTVVNAADDLTLPVPCYDAKRFWHESKQLYQESIDFVYDNDADQHTTKIAFLSNKEKGTWTVIRYDKYIVCVIGYGKFDPI